MKCMKDDRHPRRDIPALIGNPQYIDDGVRITD